MILWINKQHCCNISSLQVSVFQLTPTPYKNKGNFRAPNMKAHFSSCTYHFCPRCMTLRSAPYLFCIHLIPCCGGSIIRGQCLQFVRIVAFSVDILSLGSPSLSHAAIVPSSVNVAIGPRPSVTGIGTFESERNIITQQGYQASRQDSVQYTR